MSTRSNRLLRGCTHLLGHPSGTVVVCDDHEITRSALLSPTTSASPWPSRPLAACWLRARGVCARFPCLSLLVRKRGAQGQSDAASAANAVGGKVKGPKLGAANA